MKLKLLAPLEASSWENIPPTRLLELTFSFIWLFMGVCRFNKQNVRDVSQAIEQESAAPQAMARKSVELDFLGFNEPFSNFQDLV